MPVSEIIGGLPLLSNVFDHGPLVAALVTFVMMFGITYPLICWEWKCWLPIGRLYRNFLLCDAFVYPCYMALATSILGDITPRNFWSSHIWQVGILALGAFLSLMICWWEVRIGKYSLKMQWTPWKIWHTLTFPVAFYWIVGTLPMVLLQGNLWAIALVMGGALLFVVTSVDDAWLPGMPKTRRRLARIFKPKGT